MAKYYRIFKAENLPEGLDFDGDIFIIPFGRMLTYFTTYYSKGNWFVSIDRSEIAKTLPGSDTPLSSEPFQSMVNPFVTPRNNMKVCLEQLVVLGVFTKSAFKKLSIRQRKSVVMTCCVPLSYNWYLDNFKDRIQYPIR